MTDTQKINKICSEIMNPQGAIQLYLENNIPEQYRDDLFQEIMVILLSKPKKLIESWENGWLKYYFVNISSKQFFSSTSPFHKKYRNKNSEMVDIVEEEDDDLKYKEDIENKFNILNDIYNKTQFTWYENQILDYYFKQNLSYKKIEKETGVDSVSAYITVHKCLNKIKDNLPSNIKHLPKKDLKQKK